MRGLSDSLKSLLDSVEINVSSVSARFQFPPMKTRVLVKSSSIHFVIAPAGRATFSDTHSPGSRGSLVACMPTSRLRSFSRSLALDINSDRR